MTHKDDLLSYVTSSLEREFKKLKVSELDRMDARKSVYEIFESSDDEEVIVSELIEYLIGIKELKKLGKQLKANEKKGTTGKTS